MATIRPNLGVALAYRKRLDVEIGRMQRDIVRQVRAQYTASPPELLAQDASPAMQLRALMRKLTRKWVDKFDKLAPTLAEYFAKAATGRSDAALASILRDAGFTVRWRATAAQNDAYQAVIGENVDLIKSIASQHLTQIQGDVMRSVQNGRDLGTLAKTLEEQYGVTKRRAAFIARDQNNKATATMTRVRFEEAGIKRAKWRHSGGGKTPRPSHVAYSGKSYDIRKGAYIDGKWIQPGEEPNCRCVPEPIIPGFDA